VDEATWVRPASTVRAGRQLADTSVARDKSFAEATRKMSNPTFVNPDYFDAQFYIDGRCCVDGKE